MKRQEPHRRIGGDDTFEPVPEDEHSVISCGIGSGDDFRLLDDDDDEDDSQMLLITGDSGGLAASYSLLNRLHEQ